MRIGILPTEWTKSIKRRDHAGRFKKALISNPKLQVLDLGTKITLLENYTKNAWLINKHSLNHTLCGGFITGLA